MAIELITCKACGAKNSSNRAVCLSCGASLEISQEIRTLTTKALPLKLGIICVALLFGFSALYYLVVVSPHKDGPQRQIEKAATISQVQHQEAGEFEGFLKKAKEDSPKEYERMMEAFVPMTLWALAQLGYPVERFDTLDEKARTALRKYQKDRGIPDAGDLLSPRTIEQLLADARAVHHKPLGLQVLGKFTLFNDDFWNAGYVKAQGTWVQLSGENPYTENIRSIIQCSKDTKACVEAQVGVVEKTFLALSLETYEIERWDQQEIVTKPRDAVCARDILRFNRSQKSVTAINSTISTKGLCEGVDATERYFVLSDPSKIDKRLLEEHSKKVRELLSPELRQALDNMKAEVSKK